MFIGSLDDDDFYKASCDDLISHPVCNINKISLLLAE